MNTDTKVSEHLSKSPSVRDITYEKLDPATGLLVEVTEPMMFINAEVVSIPAKKQANSKGTEWRLIQVLINNPKVGLKQESAQLFEKSLAQFGDVFTKGGNIELMVQTTGEYSGFAKAQLPQLSRIKMEDFAEIIGAHVPQIPVTETTF